MRLFTALNGRPYTSMQGICEINAYSLFDGIYDDSERKSCKIFLQRTKEDAERLISCIQKEPLPLYYYDNNKTEFAYVHKNITHCGRCTFNPQSGGNRRCKDDKHGDVFRCSNFVLANYYIGDRGREKKEKIRAELLAMLTEAQ
jgi:hypothetical protein